MAKAPAYQIMMRGVVKALQHFRREAKASEIDSFVLKEYDVTEDIDGVKRQISFSRNLLKKMNVIHSVRHGYWKLYDKYLDYSEEQIRELLKDYEQYYNK